MRYEYPRIKTKYIELNRELITDSPFCRDIFHCKVISQYNVELTYTLQLFNDCRDLIGEFKADCELESNQRLTKQNLDEFMSRISRFGRMRFNEEAEKFHIRLYIPDAEKIFLFGEIEDAA
jgi:hypothetical protein